MESWLLPHRVYVVAFCICLLCASCAREEAAVPPGGDTALAAELLQSRDALAARKGTLEAVEAEWDLGDTKSSVTGYYDGAALVLIEETMTMGEFGSARSTYSYSPKGNLFAYTEEKESQSGVRSGNARTEHVQLNLLFEENGSLLTAERTVDGAPSPLTGMEAQGVKMHARELELSLAEKRAPATP